MIYRQYEDFSSLFTGINHEVITEGQNNSEIYRRIAAICLPLTVLEAKSDAFSYNLADLWYHKNKFEKLKTDYVNRDEFIRFRDRLKNEYCKALTFYFRTDKKPIGTAKKHGPCLLEMVVTRDATNEWNEVAFFTKITEMNRRFCADLILYRVMLRELSDIFTPSKITIVIAKPYIDMYFMTVQDKMFEFDMEQETKYIQIVSRMKHNILTNQEVKYKKRQKLAEILNGKADYPSVNEEDLKII